jgi:hypothetical protein
MQKRSILLRAAAIFFALCLCLGFYPPQIQAKTALPPGLAGRWQPAPRTAKINRALPASAMRAKPRLTVTRAGRATLRLRPEGRKPQKFTARVRKVGAHRLVITVRKRQIKAHYRLQRRRLMLTVNRQTITLQKIQGGPHGS